MLKVTAGQRREHSRASVKESTNTLHFISSSSIMSLSNPCQVRQKTPKGHNLLGIVGPGAGSRGGTGQHQPQPPHLKQVGSGRSFGPAIHSRMSSGVGTLTRRRDGLDLVVGQRYYIVPVRRERVVMGAELIDKRWCEDQHQLGPCRAAGRGPRWGGWIREAKESGTGRLVDRLSCKSLGPGFPAPRGLPCVW